MPPMLRRSLRSNKKRWSRARCACARLPGVFNRVARLWYCCVVRRLTAKPAFWCRPDEFLTTLRRPAGSAGKQLEGSFFWLKLISKMSAFITFMRSKEHFFHQNKPKYSFSRCVVYTFLHRFCFSYWFSNRLIKTIAKRKHTIDSDDFIFLSNGQTNTYCLFMLCCIIYF